jgi:hypothetical protein
MNAKELELLQEMNRKIDAIYGWAQALDSGLTEMKESPNGMMGKMMAAMIPDIPPLGSSNGYIE